MTRDAYLLTRYSYIVITMASIRRRERTDGSATFAVLWRDSDSGKQTSYPLDTEQEAERMKRLVEANGNSLTSVEAILKKVSVGGPSVRETLLRHVDMLTSAGPDAIHRYGKAIDNHFSGRLGKLPVAAIEHNDVVLWIKEMQAKEYKGKTLSAKTIANHHGLLSAAMETAIRSGHRGDNPCKGIKLPKDDATEEKMWFMNALDSLQIVETVPDRYCEFTSALRVTGGRFGEITALFPEDFNLDAPTPVVRVERAWKRDGNNRFYLGPPKTKKSRRSISLPPSFVAQVRPLVESTPTGLHVFRTTYDGPIRHSTFYPFWKEALDNLGYPAHERPRIHDMRHTHASLMLAAGMSIYELSRRLGHESIQTTIDRYSHLMPDAHFRAADIAEKALTA